MTDEERAELDRVRTERDGYSGQRDSAVQWSKRYMAERDAALAQVAKLREACGAAIVEAAFVVETLWLSQQATPFEELAPSLVEQLPVAVAALRKAAVVLAETEPEP